MSKKIAPKITIYHCSNFVDTADSSTTSTSVGQEQKKTTLSDDHKRKQLKHKDTSFWRSWFSLGSSFTDSDSDSDDEQKKKQKQKNFIKTNSNVVRPHGPVTMSTRKSSACDYTNFNAPKADDKTKKRSQPTSTSFKTLR
jgi:hypothetical protein